MSLPHGAPVRCRRLPAVVGAVLLAGACGGGRGGDRDGGGIGGDALHIRVTDAKTGEAVPAKVSLWKDGALLHLGNRADPPFCSGMGTSLFEIGTGGALATWNGLALYRGEATIPFGVAWKVKGGQCGKDATQRIDAGTWTLRASRGPEYEIAEATVDLRAGAGTVEVNLPLARTVDTSGYLAADMHIHTAKGATGSNDSSVTPEHRVMTEVAVGIEVMVSSDHDYLVDLGEPLRALWPDPAAPPPAVAVVGDEASAGIGHFNAFPLRADASLPAGGAVTHAEVGTLAPKALFERLHGLPTAPLVQINHPRLGFAAYFDSDVCGKGGWTDLAQLPGCALDFDAIEIMSGYLACDRKIRQTTDDWYALMRFGVVTTGVGNSDTHYTSGILAGFPRTYVRVPDDTVAAFREEDFVAALRQHAALATTGPFVTFLVDGAAREGDRHTATGGKVAWKARVQAASWVHPDLLRLMVNGAEVKAVDLTGMPGVAEVEGELSIGADAFVNVEVSGKDLLPEWLVGEYLSTRNPSSGTYDCANADGTAGMRPFAVTNPVLIDGDGDGTWKGPAQPVVLPTPPDLWLPSPDGAADCDPRGRRL